jgi:hypothetical protein
MKHRIPIVLLALLILGACSPPSDDITYLVCKQTKHSGGVPLFVMLDTNLEEVYLKYGKDFLEVWELIEDRYSNVSFKDNKVVFNYEFRAKEKDVEESKVTYMQVWKVMIDRYLLTLFIQGTRYSITEVDGELSLGNGEYYEDSLDCNKMDKRL